MSKLRTLLESGYRTAVLCGGAGSEREVSLVSGKAVADAVEASGLPCDLIILDENRLPDDGLDNGTHLCLPIVHGTYGEDGRLSAELEQGGFAYAGCDQAASALCFDKFASKCVAARVGIPVCQDLILLPGEATPFEEISKAIGLPFILKPRRDGSSVGLYLVRDEAGYELAAKDLSRMEYLAEAYLEGHDLTVGILGGRPLGVVGIRPEGGLYDYEHKYTSGMSHYDVPARIDDALKESLMHQSRVYFEAMGCRDLARVDFRLGNNGDCRFLEINTLPGMTPNSLLPKTASCSGIDFHQLVIEWIWFAYQRMQERGTA